LDGPGGVRNDVRNSPILRVYQAILPRLPRAEGGDRGGTSLFRFHARSLPLATRDDPSR